ncbi:MAG: hypothetical protein H6797_00685 [Candidatus Nomurabacteria bacterium]|nr:MAG: hypothetical protein H6797_00685 [Candidatus Nomurabacteria bacterium]
MREKAMQQEKVYAAVRIVPISYGGSINCDHQVIRRRHFSFQASMMLEKFNEIKRKIETLYADGVLVTQTTCGREIVLTVAYAPDYFDCFSDPQPLQVFLNWIENMWFNALADYNRIMARCNGRC